MTAAHYNGLSGPYWEALAQRRLTFQHCTQCGNNWLPTRESCPSCLARESIWRDASGNARLISWVVYHQAMDPTFAALVPYAVAIVELQEGPRLYSNIIGVSDFKELSIDQPLQLIFEKRGDDLLPMFSPIN